jgi:tRNA A37 methylthiotransferase MiaB
MQVMGGFIVGFDSDTPSIFQRQIDFIQQSGIVTAMVGMLQAPPGTRLFDRLVRERRVSDEFSGDNVDGRTNIIPAMGLDR